MKKLVITTLLAVTAFAASAQSNSQEAYGQTGPDFASTKSRAEVMTELRAAQASGTIAYGERSQSAINEPQRFSSLSRAQVKLMLRQSVKLPASGESSGA